MAYLIKPVDMSEKAKANLRKAAIKQAISRISKRKHIKCTGCGDSIGLFHHGLALVDYRETEPRFIGEWCCENCLDAWIDTPDAKALFHRGR